MLRLRRKSSPTVASNTLPMCSAAIPKQFVRAARTLSNCLRTTPKGGSEKKGGRKQASLAMPALEDNFIEVVSNYTAGDPMQEDVVWTYLTPTEIAHQLDEMGTPVCADTVRDLLDQ